MDKVDYSAFVADLEFLNSLASSFLEAYAKANGLKGGMFGGCKFYPKEVGIIWKWTGPHRAKGHNAILVPVGVLFGSPDAWPDWSIQREREALAFIETKRREEAESRRRVEIASALDTLRRHNFRLDPDAG